MATEVKETNGSFIAHPERRPKTVIVGKAGRPDKPEVIRDNDLASEKWDQICELLEMSGVLTKTDVDLLECYCITFAMYRKALRDVNRTGQVLVIKKDGNTVEVKRSPFSVELHKYMDRLQKLQAELGLTPSSRARLSAGTDESEEDPINAFFRMRSQRRSDN